MNRATKTISSVLIGLLSVTAMSAGVSALDNGTAQTPPMGWSSWNQFHQTVTEDLIKETADALEKYGLVDLGYNYVNIDDNWQSAQRDQYGDLTHDPFRFPHGIKYLADYVHDKDMKLGLYTSNGKYTCEELPASLYNEYKDAKKFAEWGIDYFKYDYCHTINMTAETYPLDAIFIKKAGMENADAPYATYEAEDATLTGNASIVTDTGVAGGSVRISGGKYVTGLNSDGGAVVFENVTVDEAGTYDMMINWVKQNSSGKERSMFVEVNNNGRPTRCILPNSVGWAKIGRFHLQVELEAGVNTIKVYNPIRSSFVDRDSAVYHYGTMRDALMTATADYAQQNGTEERPICFEICEWGGRQPWTWGQNTGNLWRTTGDIGASWSSIISIYETTVKLYNYAEPGSWNHPDMLEVGNGNLTKDENEAHFSLWCMMASPLILGNDVRLLDERTDILEIISNKDAIAIDQDARGIQGIRFKDDGDLEYLAKPLSDGKIALCMLNRGASAANMGIELASIADYVQKMDPGYFEKNFDMEKSFVYKIKDVWTGEEATSVSVNATVPTHGVKMYIIEPTQTDKGAYLLGSVNKQFVTPFDSFIVTGKFVNGGTTNVKMSVLSLDLPEGYTARPLTSTVGTDMAYGDEIEAKWLVTASGDAGTAQIKVKADLIYDGDEAITSIDSPVSVEIATPIEDGPLTKDNWMYGNTGWGNIGINKNLNGKQLEINGEKFDTGFGVHAKSEIAYFLGGREVKLTGFCGVDSQGGGTASSVTFEVWGDDTKLYDSGKMVLADAAKALNVDLKGYNILKLVVTDSGNGNTSDHADWCDIAITSNEMQPIDYGDLTMDNWMSGKVGWGTMRPNKSIGGNAIKIDGVTYEKGLGAHATAEFQYYIGGKSVLFEARGGIDDEVIVGSTADWQGEVAFKVYGDDVLLYDSGMITGGVDTGVDISVPVVGYDVLKLVIDEGTDDRYDHADFGNPRISEYIATEELGELIAKAEELAASVEVGDLNGQYAQETVDNFHEAIANAQAIIDGENLTAQMVDEAFVSLKAAMESFSGAANVVDRTNLGFVILEGMLKKEADYTEASWAVFAPVFENAWNVITTEAVSQADVDAAETALLDAIAQLREVGYVPELGDVNCDGVINNDDLMLLKAYINGQAEFTAEQFAAGDIDGNGKINVLDLLQLKLMIANAAQ
ncbi:NPCBM/NEW2 domain-containing protein [Candidatus Soleaferrea massiliensis]|uniref:NPCBM/NEW2 domain-containing protein n=1 Tax=Candidatus Soleaferrea massiliensis TaxID=1470354 RepID=UPI00059022C9|nr:NPCBM/NEW2 domain-containing protein [Candidatus Soleaferrea massiliensis]